MVPAVLASKHHRQSSQASEAQVGPPRQRPRSKPQIGKAANKCSKGDLAFDACEGSPKAKVASPPKGDVPVVGPANVKPVWVAKANWIAIGRTHYGDHRLAPADKGAPKLDVFWSESSGVLAGAFVAQQFF